jgi:hypothetical protein
MVRPEKSGFRASTIVIFFDASWFRSRKSRISAFEATPGFLASSSSRDFAAASALVVVIFPLNLDFENDFEKDSLDKEEVAVVVFLVRQRKAF